MESALLVLAATALGLLTWPLIEYGVHGVLAHRLRTFVSPLHGVHHTDPRRVFTSPLAWVPATLAIGGLAVWGLGAGLGLGFTAGALLGFLRYELIHWRIHFRLPRNAAERRRREHHLAHHFADARHYHGVTTPLWDRVFGTLPAHRERDYARVRNLPPLR